MSANQDRNRSLLINPLPIIMVLLLAAGVLVKNIPLESARPSDVERVKFVPIGEQNVEARLWQDPFAAIEKHEERFTQTAVQQQTEIISQAAALKSEKLSGDVRGYRIDGNVKVLAVSVFGGSFAEAAESRRRTRFAVVSALGFHGYSPKNSDAIGYFRLDQGRSDSESENIAIDHQVKQITIPFEWFEKSDQPTSKVLLLWLNESLWLQESKEEPDLVYGKLSSLFEELTVVGPAGSGMLMELASRFDESADQQHTIRMFSPSATITDCDLSGSSIIADQQPWQCFLDRSEHRRTLEKQGIVRTIGTDDVLAVTLLWELWQRGVNRQRSWPLQDKHNLIVPQRAEPCKDGLVLISEWDSAYARTLSGNLTDSFTALCQTETGNTPPVHRFNYLRGLDGVLPSVDKPSAKSGQKQDGSQAMDLRAQLEAVPPEHAEGLSQYDYLRRLANEIAKLDRDPQFAERGVQAIGIVGSDVYDKLLILQALRGYFKGKIFFTTDLDARYLHADQKNWARNLVVASNFGLALHPKLQESALPFRDGYQTSTYLASLMALSSEPLDHWTNQIQKWLRPQIFEIGRTEAVRVASPAVDDLIDWIKGRNPAGESRIAHVAPCEDWTQCERIEPANPAGKFSISQPWQLLLVCFLLGVWALITSRRAQSSTQILFHSIRSIRYSITHAHPAIFWIIALVAVAIPALMLTFQAIQTSIEHGTGEPYVWLEGVSVWPNLVIRFIGLITMLVLILVFVIRIRRQALAIVERFNLAMPSTWWLARSRFSALGIGPYVDLLAFDAQGKTRSGPPSGEVEVSTLWQNYLRATSWREMIGWIALSTLLVFTLSIVAFSVLDIPSFPHRGELVRYLHYLLMGMTAPILWLIIFWIGYESRACTQFIEALGHVRRQWPTHLLDREASESGIPRPYLDYYLDFQLIVAATQRIQWLIYLPFISILFMVVARSDLFDAMDFPLALIMIVIVALLYTLYTARLLSKSAAAMRAKVLAHYEEILLRLAQPQAQLHITTEQINRLIERIRNTREGAFAPLSQQPALQALLLPFGGFGGAQLIDYLFMF
jgi:hypothetical protein